MADPSSPAAQPASSMLLWLGRILPREFVDRVAEPALTDEVRHWSTRGRVPVLGRTRFLCSCLLVGAPQLFWAHRRPTGVTLFLAGSAMAVLIAFVLFARSLYQVPAP
jgi:hypothetical protein